MSTLYQKDDYAYCQAASCIHRRGCKRWAGNYKVFKVNDRTTFVDPKDCEPNLNDVNCENKYDLLDRFRYSDGSEM